MISAPQWNQNVKTLALIANKGGVGKTTLSINLGAIAASTGLSVAIIDLDSVQVSSAKWGDAREANGNDNPTVLASPAPRLDSVLKTAAKQGVDLAILDTGPQSESAVLAAAKAADYCIVPTRPSLVDLEALSITSDLLMVARTPSAVVINAWKSAGQKLSAEQALKNSGYVFQLCPVAIKDRNAIGYAYATAQGISEYEPSGKATLEMQQLFKWITAQLEKA